MSSRRLQDMSSRCLQDVLSVTIFRLSRRLQIVFKASLQDVFKTSWKVNCYTKDVLKMSSRHVLKSSTRTNVYWECSISNYFWQGKVRHSWNDSKLGADPFAHDLLKAWIKGYLQRWWIWFTLSIASNKDLSSKRRTMSRRKI